VKRVCLYCKREFGTTTDYSQPAGAASHGICAHCVRLAFAGNGTNLQEFLDGLPGAVLVTDENVRVIGVNAAGQRLLSARSPELRGRLGGEIFECQHARLPGGCGQTIHCRACTIRTCVTHTHTTGEPRIRVPAYMDLGDLIEDRRPRFLISTSKLGEAVLLRIDQVEQPVTVHGHRDRPQSDSSSRECGLPEKSPQRG
jgi:hypothetical protein